MAMCHQENKAQMILVGAEGLRLAFKASWLLKNKHVWHMHGTTQAPYQDDGLNIFNFDKPKCLVL